MNREIKFRGKSLASNLWIYGYYTVEMGMFRIDRIRVDKNTVGQFIGLYDKYGTEIYEDDTLRCGEEFIRIEYKANEFVGVYLGANECEPDLSNRNYLQWEVYSNMLE